MYRIEELEISANHSVISTVKLHGMSCWRCLGEFFKKIFNGCRDFFSMTPANIGMAYAKYRANEYKAGLLDLYRMHANFAAIYTGVPVFGLSYSYKVGGAFLANGLDVQKQTASIINITSYDIDKIIEKIDYFTKNVFK